jgi:SpoVK/Ycf46/Vps4 family AAA+-type ATPase
VFLKLLEYYQGVLFLTTNRLTDIDEAFFSRISIGLNYPNLDDKSRHAIWKNHTAGKGMHSLDLEALSKKQINGRQIKNCVRNAMALAKFEGREVTMRDIEQAIQMTTDFEAGY